MQLSQLEKEIISYLLKHPEAQDSIEGITEWWLLEERITTAMTQVEAAVATLLEREFVIELKLPGNKRLVRLNAEKRMEIEQLLTNR